MHRIGRAMAEGRITPQPDDAHIESLGESGESPADVADTDDEQRLAGKLVLALRQIADHLAPDAPCLIVARLGKPAAQGENERHCVLGHGTGIDPTRAGQTDAAERQLIARELVGPGADRLDKAQPRRALEQIIPP